MREIDGDSNSRVVRQAPPSRNQLFPARNLIVLVAIVFSGCALPRAAPASRLPALDISGVWEGTSTVRPCGFFHSESVCNAVNRITLALVQNGSAITGHYRCEFGNYICRHDNMARSGYISSGKIIGRRMSIRIMIPADVSSCMFYGTFSARRATGAYSCYEGGGVVEVGIWETERVY